MKQRIQRRSSPTSGTPSVGAPASDQGPGNAATATAVNATKGPGTAYPFADQIQAAFGGHDISGLRAHTGPEAEQATDTLNAAAFAYGEDVAFAETPDLFTAVHEAVHGVMQGAGVGPDDAIGSAGDAHEQLADTVASRVVAGESAADLLDQAAGPGVGAAPAPSVQLRELPKKEVPGHVHKRTALSADAIRHTEGVMSEGRGNQYEDLKKSNFNSYFRMAAMRDPECWYIAPHVMHLARAFPDALTAAKAGLAKSGNCGEYAAVAMDWLRVNAPGEHLNYSVKEGLDHAFVIIGDIENDADNELVVADAWPTAPIACLWEDFFAYTPDRSQLQARRSLFGDGEDVAAIIATGLRLTPKGHAWINHSFDDDKTAEEIEKGRNGDKPWIWRHENTARRGREFDYVGPEEEEPAHSAPEQSVEETIDETVDEEIAHAVEESGPELLDLNSATFQQLRDLPGIGATLAQRIIDYRARHGAFGAIGELRRITGISSARVRGIEELVRV